MATALEVLCQILDKNCEIADALNADCDLEGGGSVDCCPTAVVLTRDPDTGDLVVTVETADGANPSDSIPLPSGTAEVTDNANGSGDVSDGANTCTFSTESVDFTCENEALRRDTTDLKTGTVTTHRSNPTHQRWLANSTYSAEDQSAGPLIGTPPTQELYVDVTAPHCGARVMLEHAYSHGLINSQQPGIQMLTSRSEYSLDGGATWTNFNTAGTNSYLSHNVGDPPYGYYGETNYHSQMVPWQILPAGVSTIGARYDIFVNTTTGAYNNLGGTFMASIIHERCC